MRVLVLGPGGIKGLCYLGALRAFEEKNALTTYFNSFYGVSIGSIICLLITCGYSIPEIINATFKYDFFKDLTNFDFKQMMNLNLGLGLLSNTNLKNLLEKLIIDKISYIPNLASLKLMTGVDLNIVVYNFTQNRCEVMNAGNSGNISCIEAALCSVNFPIIFKPMTIEENLYLDGSFINPFPLDLAREKYPNAEIIGIVTESYVSNHNFNILDYLHAIFDAPLRQLINKNIQKADCHVLILNAPSATFSATLEVKNGMLVQSYHDALRFMEDLKDSNSVLIDPFDFNSPMLPSAELIL